MDSTHVHLQTGQRTVVFLQRHNSHSSIHCARLEEEEEAGITEACKDTGRIYSPVLPEIDLPLSLSVCVSLAQPYFIGSSSVCFYQRNYSANVTTEP